MAALCLALRCLSMDITLLGTPCFGLSGLLLRLRDLKETATITSNTTKTAAYPICSSAPLTFTDCVVGNFPVGWLRCT